MLNSRTVFCWYEKLRTSLWVQFFYSLILALGPIVVGYSRMGAADKTATAPPFSQSLAVFFNSHPNWTFICCLLPCVAVLMKFVGHGMEKKLKFYRHINDKGLVHLLNIFDGVVGKKMEMLGKKTLKLFQDNADVQIDEKCFLNDPPLPQMHQIHALMDGLFHMFRVITEEERCSIKITLAFIRNAKIHSWIYFLPQDLGPVASIEDLQHKCSGFSQCVRANKTLIIGDLEKEFRKNEQKKRFFSKEPREGSLICFPVFHRNLSKVLFVISIITDKKGTFKDGERDKYSFVLSSFAKRILVEYDDMVVNTGRKENANTCAN